MIRELILVVSFYKATPSESARQSRLDNHRIVNFSYYLFCVGSIGGGNFYLSINTAIQPVNARMGLNIPGTSEVQMITIGSNVVSEHQVI